MSQLSSIQPVLTEQIRVRGLVQGVGFRPTVYRIAQQLDIQGEVINDGKGVLILAQASASQIDDLIVQLQQNPPPLAHIESIQRSVIPSAANYRDFTIQHSRSSEIQTGIIADAATCTDCLSDINEPGNRRAGYPFTNCTHCGPRLSIVHNIPYDRRFTSMGKFTQCAKCQQEYDTPLDRRFHAQPNACPDCGPVLQLVDAQNNPVISSDIIRTSAELIRQGYIIAIKGIGGFQLACDASNDDTVKTLRRRKHRPARALALMARDIPQIQQYCTLSEQEQQLLSASAAPIVVLSQHRGSSHLSQHLAPGQNSLGFMLPYSPLHHLLMQQLDQPVVLTSGNASEEPQCIDNQQAQQKLTPIADYFVLHNRDIVNRIDDSVVRVIDGQACFYRRARGYAPSPIALPEDIKNQTSILACGSEMKNTFALLRDNRVTLSQHMGNLENLQTYDDYLKNIELYQRLYDFSPAAIAIDAHPEYLSSKLGRQLAEEHNIPLIEIQHHHAHIAACMADNQWPSDAGQVIGVALDGLGYGTDGTIWGGEFLLADYRQYQRLGSLKPVALAGGVKAMIEPWRNCYAQLRNVGSYDDLHQDYAGLNLFQYLDQKPLSTLERMIQTETNAPLSSSAGRLFDAVAAALGICREQISYEGQAAIELEALVDPQQLMQARPYPFELQHQALAHIDPAPMWQAMLHDLQTNRDKAHISTRFHSTLAHMVYVMVTELRKHSDINTVALSGGVFQNPSLLKLTSQLLDASGFNVLCHRQVPANDGGLSLGQAAIAAARLSTGEI